MTLGQDALETVVFSTTKRHIVVALPDFHHCVFSTKHTVIVTNGNEQEQVCPLRKCENVLQRISVQTPDISDTALGGVRVDHPVVVAKHGRGTHLASEHICVVASMAGGMGHGHFVFQIF